MEKLNQLQQILNDLQADIDKFYNKNQNAAGTRLRKGLNSLRQLASDIRKDIQSEKSSRKSNDTPELKTSGDSDSFDNIKNRTQGTGGKEAFNSNEMSSERIENQE